MTTHHLALIVAYGAALLGWLIPRTPCALAVAVAERLLVLAPKAGACLGDRGDRDNDCHRAALLTRMAPAGEAARAPRSTCSTSC